MDGYERALSLLPQPMRAAAGAFSGSLAEEFRLRIGKAPSILADGKERVFVEKQVQEEDLMRILEKATGASLHTAAPAMAEGYLSYRGLRIGVCGTAVLRNGTVSGFRSVSSLAIRIPRECCGICDRALETLTENGFSNTLVIARPGGGKTTALRDLIRGLSRRGLRVGVADERNELAAVDGPLAQFDLGPCSDVLTGIPKAEAAMMLLRGMNPEIIAMDEITRERDMEAVLQIHGCGVGILSSVHATDPDELRRRRESRELLERGIFRYVLQIQGTGCRRRYRVERLQA